MLKGLYMSTPACGHTYEIQSIHNPILYLRLKRWFHLNKDNYRVFLQGDSQNQRTGDFGYLIIEFLGMDLNDDTALELCEKIGTEIGYPLVDII